MSNLALHDSIKICILRLVSRAEFFSMCFIFCYLFNFPSPGVIFIVEYGEHFLHSGILES